MRRNSSGDNFEDALKNPLYITMGSMVGLLVVFLFCFVVWNVSHSSEDKLVLNNQTESEVEIPSMAESSEEVVVPGVEPEIVQDAEVESIEKLIAEGSNDQGVAFTETDDYVTALEVTNMRSEPSTAQGVNTVVAKLNNGEVVRRIGINEEIGWSKLIYNDQIVYASTAYLLEVEAPEE